MAREICGCGRELVDCTCRQGDQSDPGAGRDIESTPEQVVIQSFVGADDAAVLRDIAAWIEADPARVLIGLWSTGFGEAWEVDLQVIATTLPGSPDEGVRVAEARGLARRAEG